MPPTSMSLPKRVSKAEAARRLGVPISTIYRLIADNELEVIRPVGNIRAIIVESSLAELVARVTGKTRHSEAG